ncbi:MAG: homoserine O-acetyltransferase [Planctomycetota bacterium]|nr:MAG: homoserine O-acetyltransferase [Planctomycetota bacterium]
MKNDDTQDKFANSVGIVRTQQVTLFEPPNVLKLECGQTLGPIEVAYETYGQLNQAHDNAIMICHALSGDAHVAGYHSKDDYKPGWWDIMIGPGKGIDTNKYFVLCSNILGGCKGTTGPSSINPKTGKPWGLDFPVITIEDMVKVQKRLIEYLGIEKLLAVIGGSMGGMQVLEWAARYPDSMVAVMPIATTARLNAQSIAFDAVGRNAVLADPNFQNGQYHNSTGPDRGLAIARMVGHITYLSEQGMHVKFGRELRDAKTYSYDFGSEFSVETYLDYQGRAFVERFDANSYLYITKAMDYYDLAAKHGSLEEAFRNVTARFLVMSFTSDWLFTPQQSRQIVDALLETGKNVSYSDINSCYGHDAFLLEPELQGRLISGFLASASGKPVSDSRQYAQPYRQAPAIETTWTRQRVDYDLIEELIEPGSSVLDLGCGNGILLSRLIKRKNVNGRGIELDQDAVCECIDRGIQVIQRDLEVELPSLATDSYDYVILSQTLQTVRHPELVLREMLRIGCCCIVSFPNFGYFKSLLQLIFTGKMPVTKSLPFSWYNTPNLQYLTIRDFETYCRDNNVRILRRIPLVTSRRTPVRFWPTRRAEEAIFMISKKECCDRKNRQGISAD